LAGSIKPMGSEEPEQPQTGDDPSEGFETGPAVEGDEGAPSEGFATGQEVRGLRPSPLRRGPSEQKPREGFEIERQS